MAGAKYLRQMKDRFGDKYRLAYHDGPGAVSSGHISKAALDYANLFDSPTDVDSNQSYSTQPREYQGGSKFMQPGVTGGSGVLGQDMDPVRRAYLHTIQQLAQSENTMAVEMAAKLYEHMQEAHMKDIERTALGKDIALTNEVPGTASYDALVKRALIKPNNQTVINNGSDYLNNVMPDSEVASLGLPTGPGHPKYWRTKEGPKPIRSDSGTEAEAKAAFYAGNMKDAHSVINATQNNVDHTKLGIKHIITDIPWAGEFISSNYANPQLTNEEQLFDNAVDQFVAGVNRSESGATVTPLEWQKARNRFIPGKGDKPEVIAQKAKNREIATRMMMESGGLLGQSQLEAFDKSIDSAKKASPALPKLPEGWRWEK